MRCEEAALMHVEREAETLRDALHAARLRPPIARLADWKFGCFFAARASSRRQMD